MRCRHKYNLTWLRDLLPVVVEPKIDSTPYNFDAEITQAYGTDHQDPGDLQQLLVASRDVVNLVILDVVNLVILDVGCWQVRVCVTTCCVFEKTR